MHNLLCVMTRREESYHRTLREFEQGRRKREAQAKARLLAQNNSAGDQGESAGLSGASEEPASPHTTIRTKEPDLDRLLVFDHYRRNSLVDHFLAPSATLADFAQARFEEQGNFVELPYESEVQLDKRGIMIRLARDGQVRRAGALSPLPVRLTKTLFLPSGEERLMIYYTIQNKGQSRLQTRFACEWNFHLLGGGRNDQAYYHVNGRELEDEHFDSTGEVTQVQAFHIGNRWIKQDMGFLLNEAATLWRFSIETITGSEAGFERNHQGSCLTLLWPLLLEPGQSWSIEISCSGHEI